MRLQIIQDRDLSIAALVDMDTFQGYGPAVPGPNGVHLLQQWLASNPYSLESVPSAVAVDFFAQYLHVTDQLDTAVPETEPPAPSQAETPPDGGQAALAEAEAQNAPGTPPAQPADTDPTATAGPTPPEPSVSTQAEPAVASVGGSGSGEPASSTLEDAPTTGSGPPAAPATRTVDCAVCRGTGSLTFEGEHGPITNPCGACNGSGHVTIEV